MSTVIERSMCSTSFESAIDPKLLVAGSNEDRAGTLRDYLMLQDSGYISPGTFAPQASGHGESLLEGPTRAPATGGPPELTDEGFISLLMAATGGAGHTPLDFMDVECSAELNMSFEGYESGAPTPCDDLVALEHPPPVAFAPAHMVRFAPVTDPTTAQQHFMDFVDYAQCYPPSLQTTTLTDDSIETKRRQDLVLEADIQYVHVTGVCLGSAVGEPLSNTANDRPIEGREAISFPNCVQNPPRAHSRKNWKYWERDIEATTDNSTSSATSSTDNLAQRPTSGKGSRGPYKKRKGDFPGGILASLSLGCVEENGVKKKRHGGGRSKGNTNCAICNKNFARTSCLKVHMDTIHGEGIICECGSKFSGRSSHRRHHVSGVCKGPKEE